MSQGEREGAKDEQLSSAPGPVVTDGLWLDDFSEGQKFRSGDYELTKAELVEFASRFDPQLYHLDEEKARGTFFASLAASGWHTAAITMRLFAQTVPIATGVIGSDISLKWPSATRPGDRLHLEIVVRELTLSQSRPDRGAVVFFYETVNQDGEVRQQTTARSIAWLNPKPLGTHDT